MQKLIISFLAGLALSLSNYSMEPAGLAKHVQPHSQTQKPISSETSFNQYIFKSRLPY